MHYSMLDNYLATIKARGLLRERRSIESAQGPIIQLDNKQVLNFCNNDYLGLANDPRLIEVSRAAFAEYGIGAGASPMICGRSKAHRELEETIAEITVRDRAVIFSSGYHANLSAINALLGSSKDLVVQDKLSHASIVDGALLSPARRLRYLHNDMCSLEQQLQNNQSGIKIIQTDSIFSMDGDIAPLDKISSIGRANNALCYVDDAHGFGVQGSNGSGTVNAFGLEQDDIPLLMATFGKAVGAFGAFIAGPDDLIELLIQKSRAYIYSTALPSAYACIITQSLKIIREENWRRDKLFALIKRFKTGAAQLDLPLLSSDTQIQPLMVNDIADAMAVGESLLNKGILITPIRPPTVPRDSSRLRITITAAHDEKQIDILLTALAEIFFKDRKKSDH